MKRDRLRLRSAARTRALASVSSSRVTVTFFRRLLATISPALITRGPCNYIRQAGVQIEKPGLAFALLAGLLCLDPEEEESARHGSQVTPLPAIGLCSFPHPRRAPDYWRASEDTRRKAAPIQ